MTRIIWGTPEWTYAAIAFVVVAVLVLAWSYTRARTKPSVRFLCAVLKTVGIAALALSLLEPLLTGTRPRRGANVFVVLADNSRSLRIRDEGRNRSRGEEMQDLLAKDSEWKTRLAQEFDVRHYHFDSQLRAVDGETPLTFVGTSSSLETSLAAIAKRFRGLPLAGVLLLTDGNRTDAGGSLSVQGEGDSDAVRLPPVFPVMWPASDVGRDIGVQAVSVSQTNFESAPAVVRADIAAVGYEGERIIAALTDANGREVERQEATQTSDEGPLHFRFQFRPEKRGVNFYRVNAFAASEEAAFLAGSDRVAEESNEQTLANNSRLLVVDQGGGPYRTLYVGGRPNWEYKFLRRAIDGDEQVELVGLLRIARKQPKFDFQRSGSRTTSPLFDGFEDLDEETAERFDQPVLVRIGTRDEAELRDGFPKSAAELFQYHAVILDDLEADFFTQDQLSLLRNFVSVRGGGLLMLGGSASFDDGDYDRTPVGELLPVYPKSSRTAASTPERGDRDYRLLLTREGWLQPWVRTRQTEEEEKKRLAAMPEFSTLNQVGSMKPGAFVLAQVRDATGAVAPALVAHQFGQGRAAALLIGDFWRWSLHRRNPNETDFDRAWRQTVRWLVSEVPERVDLTVHPAEDRGSDLLSLDVRVRDEEFRFLDNAKVTVRVVTPGGDELLIDAEPHERDPGVYTATYATKRSGAYRFVSTAVAADGSPIGESEAGWAAQPGADEFARLDPDRDALESLALETKGEVIDADRLDAFVESLSSRDVPVTEPWTSPLWHHPLYFLIAIGCLLSEWGLRRVNGLA